MSMLNKVCLITGATSGIGRATALALAEQGAELFVVCRNASKGESLLKEISQQYPQCFVTLLLGDLGCLADIRKVAQQFIDTGKPLHLLLNNAGVVNPRRKQSRDGIEETFAVNHLAYFLLTELLLDVLLRSAPARIVSVASEAYTFVKGVQFDDIEFSTTAYKTFKVYGHSKLCNILWTRQLAKKLEGSGVTANCVHPGAVNTSLGQQEHILIGKVIAVLMKPFFRSPAAGAATSIFVATSPTLDNVSGEYFSNSKPKGIRPWATDDQAAERLWQVSKDYTQRA
ncbi:Rhamnolipids biosynthesis 3-oxoacyl-[acyl-carrier-protein] reductase [Zhongshania aliphaticivorans]|uniref:Rhamnolipids biosynthesis 3-oxoacyl-[acyl-carrier-protein] reductase n=1 Tax=Zhongshania aliphaticivorans TaxID=1470434 RepID=A0A5S9PFQ1_9GAMM|nr:SDR family oxidoreductase [Zhongshania aliphaticivorans]CAA0102854.1 Rhamnolipids biosynthesis 3-oxoacyl-[acyl-carrier-protein] reductase [Zhongshania aliphaticivorans]CAA0113863.1 Rhamnolipids biosynthesis 3-oxoacyl-[acyl-carrier-protein] reductase [Zhongshania aliphaticivorans]